MNYSPEQFQQAQEMMRNMNPDTISNMMNMINQNPNLMQQAMQMTQNRGFPGGQPQINNSHEKNFLTEMENNKSKGNEYFKKGKFEPASLVYFEGLLKIKDFRQKNKVIFLKNDLQILENKIRLNYSRSKLNLGEYQIAIDSAKLVHENNKSGKSAYYWSLGLLKNGDLQSALNCALKSKEIQPGEHVDTLISDIKDKIEKNQENFNINNQTKLNDKLNDPINNKENNSDFILNKKKKKLNESFEDDFKMEKEDNKTLENNKTNIPKTKSNFNLNKFVLSNLKFFFGLFLGLLISYFLQNVKSSREV